ncbi:MAG: TerB family tellurite resistance protein [Rhodospirillales bacterium]|nr:TerB family tellurite resistance protein [Rhodospirillales bacterium]
MGYWGKIIGGMAGFAMGGPVGAMFGAALGHAADSGVMPDFRRAIPGWGFPGADPLGASARMAALLGRREQVFAIAVVTLAAKLAKCDGPVNRTEIDAFRARFRIPPDAMVEVGQLFDQARASADGFEPTAMQLGQSFADSPAVLEDVLAALFSIARADGEVNRAEHLFLSAVHRAFRLDQLAWDRARGAAPPRAGADEPDPYAVLGLGPDATDATLRATWRGLMREHHPDSLAARGLGAEAIARAGEKVARINAAWDRIKRERGL